MRNFATRFVLELISPFLPKNNDLLEKNKLFYFDKTKNCKRMNHWFLKNERMTEECIILVQKNYKGEDLSF